MEKNEKSFAPMSHRHGGTEVDGDTQRGASEVHTPYPLDVSDYDGGAGERRPAMKVAASGAAGGYHASLSRDPRPRHESRPEGAGPGKPGQPAQKMPIE